MSGKHPTPAMCGTPTTLAKKKIDRLGELLISRSLACPGPTLRPPYRHAVPTGQVDVD